MGRTQQSTLADLSPQQVRHMLRPRGGFAPYAKQMFDLYAQRPEALSVKGLDLPALRKELALIDELSPQLSQAKRKLDQLRETQLLHASNVYRATLQIYMRAKSAAVTDGDIAHAIAGLASFLKPKQARRKKAAGAPTTVTP